MAQAMILAAGRGERLRPHTDTCPKPLLRVAGKPLIEWQIEALQRAGFDDIVVNGAWLADQLFDFLGDGRRWGVRLRGSREKKALGTAGGVVRVLPWLTDPVFVVVSADIFTDFDYSLVKQHCDDWSGQSVEGGRQAHLILVEDARYRPDFSLDEQGGVQRTGKRSGTYGNIGIYRREFFQVMPQETALDLGHWLRLAVDRGQVGGEWASGQWINVGTEQEWVCAEHMARNRG
jgi:Nucleoside-diphosphate-sugar pyrophosphorylase involved in lipopolysaccharide biosynthesis/translation initiation factor 2B, gamma/epsilon subunits (eIF-2Bgamma/eIF-2Bepsilon)